MKLAQHSCRSNPELGHRYAYAVLSSDMFCAEPAPHSLQYQRPRKQQTPSEPVGFLFLVRVASEEADAIQLLPCLNSVTDKDVRDFVCEVT